MPYSYNGWLAEPGWSIGGGQLQSLIVAGESFSPGVRRGDVHTIFEYLAEQLHRRVEPVVRSDWHQADDWGYAYRINRNANNLSCHASATAIDYNATRHPNGRRGTFSRAQVDTIRAILHDLEGVVYWGGDFGGTPDEMHFEIKGSAALAARIARKILAGESSYRPIQIGEPTELNTSGEQVRSDQFWLNDKGFTLKVDGYAGPATVTRIYDFQYAAGLAIDGSMGPITREFLSRVPSWNNGVLPVADWQIRLAAFGYTIELDGEWGPQSTETLRAFQARAGIDVTGERTYQAWSALWSRIPD